MWHLRQPNTCRPRTSGRTRRMWQPRQPNTCRLRSLSKLMLLLLLSTLRVFASSTRWWLWAQTVHLWGGVSVLSISTLVQGDAPVVVASICPDVINAERAPTAARYVVASFVVAFIHHGAAVRSVCLAHEAQRHQESQGGGGNPRPGTCLLVPADPDAKPATDALDPSPATVPRNSGSSH